MLRAQLSAVALTGAFLLGLFPRAVVAGEPPVVFSPQPAEGGSPYFSIALPPGWEMAVDGREASSSQGGEGVQFVFAPADREHAHVFVTVKPCAVRDCRNQLQRAQQNEQRRFLSGDATGEEYFDAKLGVRWSRTKSTSMPRVNATFFGAQAVTFKFFHRKKGFADFLPTIRKIVEHIRVTKTGADVGPYEVDADLFSEPADSPFLTVLLWCIPAVVVVMIVIERTVAYRRNKQKLAEAYAVVEDRKAKRKSTQPVLDDADEYYRQTLADLRERQQESRRNRGPSP